jgi:hypothetical protein
LTNSSFFQLIEAIDGLASWQPSDDDELERCCYVTEAVLTFLTASEAQVPDWGKFRPAKQLANKLDAFVAGESWAALGSLDSPPAFRKLRPKRADGPNVWELRTTDVRLFGWFPGPKNMFIGVVPALKKDLRLPDGSDDDPAKYSLHVAEVAAWREEHGLGRCIWRLSEDDLPVHIKC